MILEASLSNRTLYTIQKTSTVVDGFIHLGREQMILAASMNHFDWFQELTSYQRKEEQLKKDTSFTYTICS